MFSAAFYRGKIYLARGLNETDGTIKICDVSTGGWEMSELELPNELAYCKIICV